MNKNVVIAHENLDGNRITLDELERRLRDARKGGIPGDAELVLRYDERALSDQFVFLIPVEVQDLTIPELLQAYEQGTVGDRPDLWAEIVHRLSV